MATIFDGGSYALKKKTLLTTGVVNLKAKGITPRLATIIVGDNKTSQLYVNLKKKFIESLGAEVDVYKLPVNVKFEDVKLLINTLNDDELVHGIMIQLPLPETVSWSKSDVLPLIDDRKDVDGLKEDSPYLHPTSKAVIEILKIAEVENKQQARSVSVVGSTGMVGRPLVGALKKLGYEVFESANTEADVLVSATGQMNLITVDMVKMGAIVIDVGAPFGDVDPEVESRASFITPVPGGVGPVTITCLAENLLSACQ